MPQKILSPKQSLLKNYMKSPVRRDDIMRFKEQLQRLFRLIDPKESEEHNKILVMQFLSQTYYAREGYLIDTYGSADLAIYGRSEAFGKKPIVLFEFKGPGRPGMVSKGNFRQKSMYELVLYYLREELVRGNHSIQHLVITDCNQFFVFDKRTFYELFAKNKRLVSEVRQADTNGGDRTEYIYNQCIAPVVARVEEKLAYTYLRLEDYRLEDQAPHAAISSKLVAAYKLLSPTHLLRLPFSSDHNRLNTQFYHELLYIMGLQEKVSNKKKVIARLDKDQQHYSLMEQAYGRLEYYNGIGSEKQRFDTAIGLVLTWVNRLLFLKLLESQLVVFNQSADYRFLNSEKIPAYDVLDDLFREILARPCAERTAEQRDLFANVPYLNSSLFEVSPLEQQFFSVGSLRLGTVEPYRRTVLTDGSGHRLTGPISELDYLFRFLDAFDFGDTAQDDASVSDQGRTIIDASVLGLIFEKINGYRDGSFFTPGFITQHICDNTLRQAIVGRFNEVKGWHCTDFDSLRSHIDLYSRKARVEANRIVNSLKICDLAVGSGHFLVSALNVIIALKSELGILQDHSAKPQPISAYTVGVENDELVLKDEDGEPFRYRPLDAGSRRIQQALFEEKKTIIENCLFGADLNPKSVEICQLRLWIELLKNAYYYQSGDGFVLRTLPNIDINIHCGDSLASRQPVCIGRAVKEGGGLAQDIAGYKALVGQYVDCHDKQLKREIRTKIDLIKRKLNPPRQTNLFFEEQNEESRREQKVFGHALEWMIEFPETLDGEGVFRGFDVIVGNPPYINLQGMADEAAVYAAMRRTNENGDKVQTYRTLVERTDIYALFVERALQLLRPGGLLSMIIPNKWLKVGYGQPLRRLFLEQDLASLVDFGDNQVFGDATTYTCIIALRKSPSRKRLCVANIGEIHSGTLDVDIEEAAETFDLNDFDDGIWHTASLEKQGEIARILHSGETFTSLGDYVGDESCRGLLTGFSDAFFIPQSVCDQLLAESPSSAEVVRPCLNGDGLVAFGEPKASSHIILIPKGFTRRGMGVGEHAPKPAEEAAWQWFSAGYPAVACWLQPFKTRAKRRTDKGEYWWELRACDYYDKFAEPRIMYQAFQTKPCFVFEEASLFCNNSVFFISVRDRALLSLLNSSVGWWLISEYCPRIRNGYQLIWDNFRQLPVPRRMPPLLDALARAAEAALADGDNARLADTRRRIDRAVAEAYGMPKSIKDEDANRLLAGGHTIITT